uniref:Uncharacterized protein n=1 Tax=Trypanosoma congolense (strain IL3000) TaxID=1068625 RepID=G0UK62_TRYCI|nr:conserved hypothetical protein [Trypanosoma congolense IL3000]
MDTDTRRAPQSNNWNSVHGPSEAVHASFGIEGVASPMNLSQASVMQPCGGSLLPQEDATLVSLEGMKNRGCMPSGTGVPAGAVHQHVQAVHIPPTGGPYYIGSQPYNTLNVTPATVHGHIQHQPFMFNPTGGQMVFMQLPHIQQPSYQPAQQPQVVYQPSLGACYQTHCVQMPGEGPMIPSTSPSASCRVPQMHYNRGPTPMAPLVSLVPQPGPQPQYQATPPDQVGGCVSIKRGHLLPEGIPFFPYGVHTTPHYTNTQSRHSVSDEVGFTKAFWTAASFPENNMNESVARFSVLASGASNTELSDTIGLQPESVM